MPEGDHWKTLWGPGTYGKGVSGGAREVSLGTYYYRAPPNRIYLFYAPKIEVRLDDGRHCVSAPQASELPRSIFGGVLPEAPRHKAVVGIRFDAENYLSIPD